MVRKGSAGRGDIKSKTPLVRKTSKKVVFLNKLADNCYLNKEELIRRGKESSAFGKIPWDDATWCVTNADSQRGHKQRELYLNFTEHRPESVKKGAGKPFDNNNGFSGIVKALIRLRREISGQVAANQVEIIIAFRYVYDELEGMGYDLLMLSSSHLDAAAKKVVARESETSAYKRIEKIEEIARLLDDNGLVLVPLKWKCSSNNKPASMHLVIHNSSVSKFA